MNKNSNQFMLIFLLLSTLVLGGCGGAESTTSISILNVSYDPTREFYEDYNKKFVQQWKDEHHQDVSVKQSHGGSGKQARSVMEGLKADVVTLALSYDVNKIQKNGLVRPEWQSRFPANSSPYTSTIIFVVRRGNPFGIKDWNDLIHKGISVITPNPKTSGGARYNYLAAFAYAKQTYGNNESQIEAFLKKLYLNVPILDSGARASTTTFVERQIGDVLLAWENDALLVKTEFGDEFELIYPSISIKAEPPVAIVDKVVDRKGTREIATAYLAGLYSKEAQELLAKHYLRPTDPDILKEHVSQFPNLKLAEIDRDFGGWDAIHNAHFADGALFDQIYTTNK